MPEKMENEKREVKTAVIAAGGFGTRFMPATKSIPKEMFPLGNKPIILHVVEEIVKSGITQIIFIVSHHKQSIESFFSPNQILEDYFSKIGKQDKVEELQNICELADFGFVYTKPPYGNGGALFAARHLLRKKHPFLFIWSDEIMMTGGIPRVKQVIDAYDKYQVPTVSAVKIEDPEIRSRYGMAELEDIEGDGEVKKIKRIVEKPSKGKEPSEYAAHGAYVLTMDIFDALEKTPAGKDGELWLTDAINLMKEKTGFNAKLIEDALYFDCGNPLDYLKSNIEYTLKYSPESEELKRFIREKKII